MDESFIYLLVMDIVWMYISAVIVKKTHTNELNAPEIDVIFSQEGVKSYPQSAHLTRR